MFAPCQLTLPSAGSSNPHRMRSKLVLPLPFGPVSCTKVPDGNEKSRPLKSLRSPRTHASLLTSSMGGSSSALFAVSLCLCGYSSVFEPQRHRGTEKKFNCLSSRIVSYLARGSTGPFAFIHSFQPPCRTRTFVNPL